MLPKFTQYKINGIEYCANFDLNGLENEHISSKIWSIISLGIPDSCVNTSEYFPLNYLHPSTNLEFNRNWLKTGLNSVYVKYYREAPMESCSKNSTNLICFGVRLNSKIESMIQNIIQNIPKSEISKNGNLPIIKELLSDKMSKSVVKENFEKTIMGGDYHTLKKAIQLVKDCGYNSLEEDTLIYVLKMINKREYINDITPSRPIQ